MVTTTSVWFTITIFPFTNPLYSCSTIIGSLHFTVSSFCHHILEFLKNNNREIERNLLFLLGFFPYLLLFFCKECVGVGSHHTRSYHLGNPNSIVLANTHRHDHLLWWIIGKVKEIEFSPPTQSNIYIHTLESLSK